MSETLHHRSPNYPGVNLKTAIARAKAIFDGNGRHAAGQEVIAKFWDLSHKSSTFRMVMSALRAFGLLAGEGSSIKLSPLALDIVADYPEGSKERKAAIHKAALLPKIHQSMHKRYGSQLPSDDEVRRYLVREHEPNFSDKSVDVFLDEYKETMAFANLGGEPTISPAANAQELEDAMNATKANPSAPPPITPSPPPGGRMRDLPVTLPTTLEIAVFRLPVPMTEADYKTLVNCLTAMKDTLVEKKK